MLFWKQERTNSFMPLSLTRLPLKLSVCSLVFLKRPSPIASMMSFPMPQFARDNYVRNLLQLSIPMKAFAKWKVAVLFVFFDTSRSLLFSTRRLMGTELLLTRELIRVAKAIGLHLELEARFRLVRLSLRSPLKT